MPETEEFGLKVSLNENLLEEENWKPHSGYLLPPKYMTKAAFFPWKNPVGFWRGWPGQTPGNFLLPWRTGGFNGAELPQALPTYVARLWKQRTTMKWDARDFPSSYLWLLWDVAQLRAKGTGVEEALPLSGITLQQITTILSKDRSWTTLPVSQEG